MSPETTEPTTEPLLAELAAAEKTAPVKLEPVAETPRPFRFGVRAMIVLTAICAVQFALMKYVGMLAGLLVGMSVAGCLLIGLLFAAVVLRRRNNSRIMDQLDQLAIRVVIGIVLLACGSVLVGGGLGAYYLIAEMHQSTIWERQLGFSYTEDVRYRDKGGPTHVLRVKTVTPGGVLDSAGVQADDVIVIDGGTTRDFFQFLEYCRGSTITVTVAKGAGVGAASGVVSRSLDSYPQQQLQIPVPAR